jgi:GGDEF domain-containing protein
MPEPRFSEPQMQDALTRYDETPLDQLPIARVTEAADRLFGQINYDQLTGLYNRNAFTEVVDDMTRHIPPGHTVRVAKFDLDNFKALNDGAGHDIGDRALDYTATRMVSDYARSSDVMAHGSRSRDPTAPVSRLGGDEFAAAYYVPIMPDQHPAHQRKPEIIELPHTVSPAEQLPVDAQTVRFMNNWQQGIQQDEVLRGSGIGITAGVADYKPGDSVATLLTEADGALTINKYTGKAMGIVNRAEASQDLNDLITTYQTLQASALRVPEVLPYAIRQVADKLGQPLPPELNI